MRAVGAACRLALGKLASGTEALRLVDGCFGNDACHFGLAAIEFKLPPCKRFLLGKLVELHLPLLLLLTQRRDP